jgi:hypothetical protein
MPHEEEPLGLGDRSVSFDRFFNPVAFREVEEAVARGHARAVREARGDTDRFAQKVPWRWSGGADLVNFMVYNGQADWVSLAAVPLNVPLTVLTESLVGWQADDFDPPDFAGGGAQYTGGQLPFAAGLRWAATAVGGGVLANFVWDLLKQIGAP